MNICQGLIECSKLFPEKVAIRFESSDTTYAELERQSAQAAEVLKKAGIERGDRVALILGNTPAFPIWYYAALRLGAIAVSVNTRLTAEEADFIVKDCGAKAVVSTHSGGIQVSEDGLTYDGSPLSELNGIAFCSYEELDPEEPGIILYTSGTTGFPKGATLSHGNVRSTVHSFNHLCNMGPDDVILLMVPLFHCYGQNAILNAGLNVGSTIILQRVFDLGQSKALIKNEKITKLFGVPTTFHLMLDACHPEDIASIDYCFSAAATLAPQLGAAWQEKFKMPIYEGYGLTETAPFASYNHHLKHVPGSIGIPVDMVEMKVVDPETGNTCPIGDPGEIIVRGPNVMLGYWNRPEDTAEAVKDGWFYSGDVGRMDEFGYFYIVDRIKDMIAIGGLKVFPSEVERVLLDAPGVKDCAVVGLPEPTLGEEVAIFVVAEESTEQDPEAIRAYGLAHLAQYKVPSRVIYMDELPRNPAGKVLKKELRKISPDEGIAVVGGEADPLSDPNSLISRLNSAHASARERLITDFLQETIQNLVQSDSLPEIDTALLETGMDSLMMVNLAATIQSQLGSHLDLPATLVFDYPRIKDLAGYLIEALDLGDSQKNPETDTPSATEISTSKSIDDMTEEEALAELMKELED